VIDLYQIQIPDIVQPWARVPFAPKEWSAPKDEIYWEGMVECYKRGIIANVGVSNYGPKLLRRAYEYFKSKGVPLVSNQINYSLLYRKKGAQETVDTCNELGIRVLAYFPLAMGLLTGKWKSNLNMQNGTKLADGGGFDVFDTLQTSQSGIGPVGEPLNPQLTGKSSLEQVDIASLAARATGLLQVLETIATNRGRTMSQVALNWIMCKGAIPIPGARTAAQVMDNAGALGWRLSEEEVKTLEDAADLVDADFSGAGFKRSNSKFVGYGFETWSLED
jgi:pyridoxine 4-dehydrogenase